MGRHTVWTLAMDADLTRLWNLGKTSLQIAIVLGKTKNAVVGRAHRLDLTGRPSPIKHSDGPKRPYKPRGRAPSRPLAEKSERKVRARLEALPRETTPVVLDRTKTCQWPMTDDRPWKFCGDPCQHGTPYCPGHRARSVASTNHGWDTKQAPFETRVKSSKFGKQFDRGRDAKWGM